METIAKTIITIAIVVLMRWGWELLNWAWLKPRKLENWLRNEGYKGNSYKLVTGDLKELATMSMEAISKPMSTLHNITPHALPLDDHIINKY
ncbi:hypothetical protein Tco_0043504, partial [Tanacetum coccineum]